jgi:nucleotide-binding universal stress UspA family protein
MAARIGRNSRAPQPNLKALPMKIMLSVDGSKYTKRMLAYVAAHDEWLGSKHDYTVFTGVLAVPHAASAFVDADMVRKYYEDDAEAVFRPIRSFLSKQGIEAKYEYRIGHPADLIAKAAAKGKFDLLIMGSHGHSNLGNVVLGSVATRVLGGCTTPVLLVR